MAAVLEGVSLKEVAQIAHFSDSALCVASEQGIRKTILRMRLEEEKLRYEK